MIRVNFGEGFVNPKDAGALWSAIKIETNGPSLTGKALTAVLLNRGYTERDLKKILGDNHLRVIREVTGHYIEFD